MVDLILVAFERDSRDVTLSAGDLVARDVGGPRLDARLGASEAARFGLAIFLGALVILTLRGVFCSGRT